MQQLTFNLESKSYDFKLNEIFNRLDDMIENSELPKERLFQWFEKEVELIIEDDYELIRAEQDLVDRDLLFFVESEEVIQKVINGSTLLKLKTMYRSDIKEVLKNNYS